MFYSIAVMNKTTKEIQRSDMTSKQWIELKQFLRDSHLFAIRISDKEEIFVARVK